MEKVTRSLVDPALRVSYLRDFMATADLTDLAYALDALCARSEQAEEPAREVLLSVVDALNAPTAKDLVQRLREEAAGRSLLALERLVRQPLGRVVEMSSRHDRFRPEVRPRWRESAGPGAGLWFDLGPHLADQALALFGRPRAITLARDLTRDGALADDWFHAHLRYDRLHVHLHAGMLVADSAPRFAVHGTQGSFVKRGLDTQEDALKAGVRPTWPAQPDWGIDGGPAELVTRAADGRAVRTPVALQPGAHQAYFAAVAAAIRNEAPNPVLPDEALAVMALIELGVESAAQRRELEWRISS